MDNHAYGGRRIVNHPTPRTDANAFTVPLKGGGSVEAVSAAFARGLERELAECRLRLARCQAIYGDISERDQRHADAEHFHAAAAHLRDLSQPLDPSKL